MSSLIRTLPAVDTAIARNHRDPGLIRPGSAQRAVGGTRHPRTCLIRAAGAKRAVGFHYHAQPSLVQPSTAQDAAGHRLTSLVQTRPAELAVSLVPLPAARLVLACAAQCAVYLRGLTSA